MKNLLVEFFEEMIVKLPISLSVLTLLITVILINSLMLWGIVAAWRGIAG